MGDDYFPRRSRTAFGWTFEGSRLGEQLGPLLDLMSSLDLPAILWPVLECLACCLSQHRC